jgi:hypothetical protein
LSRATGAGACTSWSSWNLLIEVGGEGVYEADGFEADADDLAEEADGVFGVGGAVGVGADAGAGVFGDAVLVDHPFDGGAVAEAVFVGFGRDAGEGERRIDDDRGFVLAEAHALDAPGEGLGGVLDEVEGPGVEFLVVDVEAGELGAGFGEGVEIGGEGDAGELALQVVGELVAVGGVVTKADRRCVRSRSGRKLALRWRLFE